MADWVDNMHEGLAAYVVTTEGAMYPIDLHKIVAQSLRLDEPMQTWRGGTLRLRGKFWSPRAATLDRYRLYYQGLLTVERTFEPVAINGDTHADFAHTISFT